MSHYAEFDPKHTHRPDPEWLNVNGKVTDVVNKWAHRDDLVASIGSSKGRGMAAALFDPRLLEIEINTKAAFGDTPATHVGDMALRKTQFEFAKASGAIFHEACHARYTTFDLRMTFNDLKDHKGAHEALMLLEEPRIEHQGVLGHPENRSFLRACALGIVLADSEDDDVKKMSGTRQAARLACLVLAREDGGVLKRVDTRTFRVSLKRILGEELLLKFQALWQEFISIHDVAYNLPRMYEIAIEWAELLNEAAADDDKKDQDAMDKAMGDIMKELGEAAGDAEVGAEADGQAQQKSEKYAEEQKGKDAKNKERGEGKKAADEVFKKMRSQSSGGPLEYKDTRSGVVEVRAPYPEERMAAVTVARALDRAKYHDRIRIESNSIVPPGRLKAGTAMQAAAYKAQGRLDIHAEPWRRVQRKHEIDPDLAVGIMVDISGSMSGAQEPMGVTAWVVNEAVRKIQGRMAMVRYGHDVTGVIAPGQHMKNVTIFSAPDGSEAFSYGFKALDGALTLLDGKGARLLCVVSDGQYKSEEIQHCERILGRCDKEGVAVIWLGYGNSSGAKAQCEKTNAEFVIPGNTPAEVAMQVGRAAIRALERAGRG